MQKLHLVGFTTDQQGLILSARRGARSGSFCLTVDEELAHSVEELRARQVEAERLDEQAAARPTGSESALSVREIQARLRQGRSVADVATAAGVDPAWVERFAAPVFAERAQVIASVQSTLLQRARLGPSEQPIGEAIRRNLADRNVSMSPDEFSSAWSARQLADGRWAVRFRHRHRGRDHVLRFELDDADGTVVAADRTSGSLAYITPTAPRPAQPPGARSAPAEHTREQEPAKRATVTVGFRPDDPESTATSPAAKERERANDAMRKAAVKAAAEVERAAARRAKEREADLARREREALAEEARRARERAAAERAKAAAARKKAAAAKKRAAERAKAKAEKQRADQARRAEAALQAAERKAAGPRKAAAAKPNAHTDPGNGLARERPPGERRTGPLRTT